MSRYTKIIKGDRGQDLEVHWGTDHALGYWYDIFDTSRGKEEWEQVIEEESTMLSGLKRNKFIDFLIEINAPEKHMKCVESNHVF